MRLRKYGKKTVSVILACAMLGTSFAQCALAEDAAETDVVVEQETQAAEVEEVGETQQESVTDAADEFVADELSAEDAETAADIADEQDGDGSDEISLTVTDIETAGPTVTAYASDSIFSYDGVNEGVKITGLVDENTDQTDLVIPSEITVDGEKKIVTEIGDKAFENKSNFTGKLTLPETLTKIGANAFKGCKFTGELKLPDSVTEIGSYAFEGCCFTGSLEIPNNLTKIADGVFKNCEGFTGELTIKGKVTSIGESAFEGCAGLTGELGLPQSLTSIGTQAFYNCAKLTGGLDLSECQTVGSKAFAGCNGLNGNLILPSTLEHVANDAVFDSIRWKDGDAPIELQLGDETGITLDTCAGNSNLTLDSEVDGLVTLSADPGDIIQIENNKITPYAAGETTITATAYNGAEIEKKVIVIEGDANTPTVEKVSFAKSAFRSDVLSLILNIKAKYVGVQALSGYFCLKTDTAQKIPFSADWTKESLYSEGDRAKEEKIEVTIPASAAVGDYCLANLTLTNTAGVSTQYTYDTTAGIWKNGAGNQVNITVDNDNTLTVKDGFGKTEGSVTVDIASPNAESLIDKMDEGNTAYVSYNNNQHTALASLFNSIKNKIGSTLVLTNGIVEWGFYASKMKSGATNNFDCLVTLAGFDASIYGNAASTTLVTFKDNKNLPCEATLHIRADQLGGLYQQTGSVYVYTQDSTTKKLTDLTKQIPVSYVLSNGQYWYEFKVNTDTPNQLILSGKPLALTPSYKVTSLTLSATSIAVAKGKKVTLTATAGPVGAANKAVTWKSSNKKVAKVSANGVVTGKKYGKAIITATAADGSGVVAKCTVRVGYKIKYKLNGGTNNAANPKAYYNQKVKLKNPTRPGYTFKGWYTDKSCKHRIKKIRKSFKKNLTLYAKWKKN